MKFNKLTYQILSENILLILLFIGGANLFIYLKTSGLDNIGSLLSSAKVSYTLPEIYMEVSILGFFVGIQIITFQIYLTPILQRYCNMWLLPWIWITSILTIILINGILIHSFVLNVKHNINFDVALQNSYVFITSKIYKSFTIYFFIVGFLVSFLRQLRQNFGEAVFLNYIFGKYSNPLVEQRSFMFLDLNDSTRIAEELGHVKYSRFLNKCFDDILDALSPYKFEIYQFVGDEVVLTWKIKDDLTGKAIDMYQAVNLRLLKEEPVYQHKFGIAPVFKAGVSSGEVTATMVGKGGKHMAYHGDVLNTTARLLGQCKKLNKSILFTDFYLKSLTEPLKFKPLFLSELQLRGKVKKSRIYSPEASNLLF